MDIDPSEWPEVGELVVATVVRIVGHGAYVTLDEYDNKEGLLHISEISSSWVRNIRNHVRERQKAVLQINRVDAENNQIDLSLRRVTQDDRRKKLEEWKKNRKAESLLRTAAQTLKMDETDLVKKVVPKVIDQYENLYRGFEVAAKKGPEAFHEAGVTKKISKVLAEIAKDKIIVKGVTIQGIFEMTTTEARGIELIKDTLLQTMSVAAENDAEVNLHTLGAPKYRIEVIAEDYRSAEATLDKIVSYTSDVWSDIRGEVTFTRD